MQPGPGTATDTPDAVVQAGEYLYTLRADRDAGIDLEDPRVVDCGL